MIIDVHTHVFPDALAPRAVGALSAAAHFQPLYDGTVKGLLGYMHANSVDYSVALSIATKAGQEAKVNAFAASVNAENPSLIAFGSVNPLSEDALSCVDEVANAGLIGIKLHPEYQRFEVLSDEAMRLYERAVSRGLTLIFHCGKDVAFPERVRCTPADMLTLHREFPSAHIICGHLGGAEQYDNVLSTLAGRDIALEASLSPAFCPLPLFEQIRKKHSPDLLLFGSDGPWCNLPVALDYYAHAGFTPSQREKFFALNAVSLLGLRL